MKDRVKFPKRFFLSFILRPVHSCSNLRSDIMCFAEVFKVKRNVTATENLVMTNVHSPEQHNNSNALAFFDT